MSFQQRQVLVRRGVKDNTGSRGLKDLPDASTVADISDYHIGAVEKRLTVKLELQGMQVRFVVVQHMEGRRAAAADLAAELLTDGAARTRHKDTFSLESGPRGLLRPTVLPTAEQAIEIDDAHICSACCSLQRGQE
jgi:hypothetical protein